MRCACFSVKVSYLRTPETTVSKRGRCKDRMALAAAVFVLLFVIYFWSVRMWDLVQNWRKVPNIRPADTVAPVQNAPLISVIVPAHNEQAAIEGCIRSVMQQDYPRFELIVADDRSEDKTLQIAESICRGWSNCKVISIRDLPHGWTGKCHALDEAVKHASGEWLAFLDADSKLEKEALRLCYNEAARNKVNLLTLIPKFVVRTFWDKALQPIFGGMCCILFPPAKVNDPTSTIACANGMFYMISRYAYEKIGGHREVSELAVEDVAIGKRVKAAGLGILMANGRNVMQTRMYTGFRETLEGWTRILSACMNYELLAVIKYLWVHILVSLPVLAAALYMYTLSARELWPDWWFILPCMCLVLMSVVSYFFLQEMGLPGKYAVILMLGNLMLIWVYAVILKRILCKDALHWRGTTYHNCRYEPGRLDPASPQAYRQS